MTDCQSDVQYQECFNYEMPQQADECDMSQQRCHDDDVGFQSIYKKCGYVQPPRAQSFRPVAYYKKPQIPFASDTIYKGSFENFDASG